MQVVSSGFVAVTVAASVFTIAFCYPGKRIHLLSFIFFLAASTAFWGVYAKHSVTDYAVGIMYAAAAALAVLMVRRTVQSTPAKKALPEQRSDSALE